MAKKDNAAPAEASEAAQMEGGAESGALVVDLSGVSDETELPVIPRGIYNAVVDELTFGYSQSSGNPMWTWRFEIPDGEYTGRKLFFHSPFVESMLPRVKKVLSRVAPELLSGPFDPEKIADEGVLLGKACRIRVEIKPYEGKARNNVRDVLASEEGGDSQFL